MRIEHLSHLRVPERDLAAPTLFDANAAAVSRWREGLPLANPTSAAPRLGQALLELSRTQIAPSARFELLELLREPAHEVTRALDEAALERSHTAGVPERTSTAQRLQRWLALAYQSVAVETIERGHVAHIRGLGAAALHRALTELGRTLYRTLALQMTVRGAAWRELYQLTAVAEHHELLNRRVQDPTHGLQPATTLGEAFLRPVLLFCAQPYALARQSIATLYLALEDWTRFVALSNDPRMAAETPFRVDFSSDIPPRPAPAAREALQPGHRGIDTRTLAAILSVTGSGAEAAIADSQAAPVIPQQIGPEVLGHLANTWSGSRRRAYRRTPDSGTLELRAGLASAHQVLPGGHAFPVLGREAATPVVGHEHATGQGWKRKHGDAAPRGGRRSDTGGLGGAFSRSRGEHGAPAVTHRCTLVDTTPGGYGIMCDPHRLPPHLRAGEIVAVRRQGEREWAVAVVRWLRRGTDQVKAGLELLGTGASGVGVKIPSTDDDSREWMRAILIPEQCEFSFPTRLILPRLPLHPGQKLLLADQDGLQRIVLQKFSDGTAAALAFEFQRVTSVLPDTGAQGASGDDSSEDAIAS